VLGFEPRKPPYVVKTLHEDGVKGLPTHEVPWRDGTRTRSARHSDFSLLLVPILQSPEIEVLSGEARVSKANSPTGWVLSVTLSLFLTPRSPSLVTLPAHKAAFRVRGGNDRDVVAGTLRGFFSHVVGSLAEARNISFLYCHGPGEAAMTLSGSAQGDVARELETLVVEGSLVPAPTGPPSIFRTTLKQVTGTDPEHFIWR
jgi:hypothetical protein